MAGLKANGRDGDAPSPEELAPKPADERPRLPINRLAGNRVAASRAAAARLADDRRASNPVPPSEAEAALSPRSRSGQAGQPLRSGQAGQPLRSGHAGPPLRSGHAGQPLHSGHAGPSVPSRTEPSRPTRPAPPHAEPPSRPTRPASPPPPAVAPEPEPEPPPRPRRPSVADLVFEDLLESDEPPARPWSIDEVTTGERPVIAAERVGSGGVRSPEERPAGDEQMVKSSSPWPLRAG